MPILVKLLKDKDTGVRRAAVSALGEIGAEAKTAVPVLAELLEDKDEQVRDDAIGTLVAIGTQPFRRSLNDSRTRTKTFAMRPATLWHRSVRTPSQP